MQHIASQRLLARCAGLFGEERVDVLGLVDLCAVGDDEVRRAKESEGE